MYDMHQSSSGTELERNAQRGWGGRRPGAGRKKGSSRRINGETRRQVLERAISVGINVESQNGRAEQEVANGAADLTGMSPVDVMLARMYGQEIPDKQYQAAGAEPSAPPAAAHAAPAPRPRLYSC
jgi:hypothetical protein